MNVQMSKPIIFFDIETTGLDISKDRIVEIYAKRIFPNQAEDEFYSKVNPEIHVPQQAVKVHGLSNDVLKNEPTFQQIGQKLFDFFQNCDVGGYNIIRFDVPFLIEEFLRNDFENPLEDANFADSMLIFHKMMPRNLAGALHYYTGEKLENAHSAKADVLATIEIFNSQLHRHSELPSNVKEIEKFSMNGRSVIDFGGYFVKDQSGDIVFNFGKYRNKKALDHTDYLDWMLNNDFPIQTKQFIQSLLNTTN